MGLFVEFVNTKRQLNLRPVKQCIN